MGRSDTRSSLSANRSAGPRLRDRGRSRHPGYGIANHTSLRTLSQRRSLKAIRKRQEEAMARETGDPPRDVSRRDLFKTVGAGAAAAVAGAPLAPSTVVAQAYPATAAQLEALE